MTRRAAAAMCFASCLAGSQALAQDAAPAPASPNPFSTLSIESLSATRSQPLFTPSRTAPVEEVVAEPEPVEVAEPVVATEPEPVPPPLRLIGVIQTSTESVALFSDEGSGQIRRIRAAETYEDWTLRIVDGQTVEFQNGELRHTLKMFEPGSDPPRSEQVMTPPQFEDGHALGAPTEDPEIMGGDLDYSEEPVDTGDGATGEGSPDAAEVEADPAEQAPDETVSPEDFPEGMEQPEY